MRDLAKLRALTRAERRTLVVCAVMTPLVAGGLSIFGFRRVHAVMALGPRPRNAPYPTPQSASDRARSVSKIVGIAAGRGRIRAGCLRRSLLLWWILRRDGIETILRVGVSREGGALRAHAWVEYMGQPLNDADDVAGRFPPFERNFGASPERVS